MSDKEFLPQYDAYVRERASDREREIDALSYVFFPRKEYIEGSIKLNYRHEFKNGYVFIATENEVGGVTILIERDGKPLVDLRTFLPNGYVFVSPTFLAALEGVPEEFKGNYFVNYDLRLVGIGDMRDPTAIFSVLHEIGHTASPQEETEEARTPAARKDKIARLSRRERAAWARAIKIARGMRHDYGIDLFENFDDFEEFKKVIYGTLLGHRFTEEIFAKEAHGLTKEDLKFFEDLFDKGKFSKDGPGKTTEQRAGSGNM